MEESSERWATLSWRCANIKRRVYIKGFGILCLWGHVVLDLFWIELEFIVEFMGICLCWFCILSDWSLIMFSCLCLCM